MNSYQSIISELIKQKQLLDDKGYTVNVANQNPSPSEITNAIEKIDFDFSAANATEADVLYGKTFFAQNNELKVGTFSLDIVKDHQHIIRAMIAGDVACQCVIPEYCSKIRAYAFYSYNLTHDEMFVQEDLIIPNHIRTIELYAFYSARIARKLYIPPNCTVYTAAFQQSTMTEVEFAGDFASSANYAIGYCQNLKKVTILEPCQKLNGHCFCSNPKLEEVYLPPSLLQISDYAFNNCSAIKIIKFTGDEPPAIGKSTFKYCTSAIIFVPYLRYYYYYTATNYLYNNQTIVGYGDFTEGDSLPNLIDTEHVVWYATVEDAVAGTNPITTSPTTGTLYMTYPQTTE